MSVADVLPHTRPSGSSRRTMIAPGSAADRPSPLARVSQSAQAPERVAAGSPDGLRAANFGPKRAAFSSGGWCRLSRAGGYTWPALVSTWVAGSSSVRPGFVPSQLSISTEGKGFRSAQTR